jgi:hypothetical protein
MALLFLLALAPSLLGFGSGNGRLAKMPLPSLGRGACGARAVSERVLPFWNPHSFCGMPFASNGQTAIFYPPNILYWLLPIRPAMLGDAFLHGVLLGCGGYMLGRALQLQRTSSIVLALCLMLGSVSPATCMPAI